MTATTIRTTYSSVINAADFNPNTRDTSRNTWTEGQMHHVIEALNGNPVAITVSSSGHTIVGAVLRQVRSSINSHDRGKVLVVTTYGAEQLTEQGTWHDLGEIGMILPLDEPGMSAKFEALGAYRDRGSAAIEQAKATYAESTGRRYGVWNATPMDGSRVRVTYTPLTSNPINAHLWGTSGYWDIHI